MTCHSLPAYSYVQLRTLEVPWDSFNPFLSTLCIPAPPRCRCQSCPRPVFRRGQSARQHRHVDGRRLRPVAARSLDRRAQSRHKRGRDESSPMHTAGDGAGGRVRQSGFQGMEQHLPTHQTADHVQVGSLIFRVHPLEFMLSLLFRYQALIKENLKEVAKLITLEQGKTLPDAEGDVMRGLQVVEQCCSLTNLLMGETLPGITKVIYISVAYLKQNPLRN